MGIIYGNLFLIEEAIENQKILFEMYFAKKDLQDVSTIDKLVKSKERYTSVTQFISTLFIIIGLLGSLAITIFAGLLAGAGGFAIIMYILINIHTNIQNLPAKRFEKQSQDFKKKVEILLSKSEEGLKSDPKNKQKYQEIINNCKKVLSEIDRREKEAKNIIANKKYKEVLDFYKAFIIWCNNPTCLGHTGTPINKQIYGKDLLYLGYILNVPESFIINNIKEKGKFEKDFELLFEEKYFKSISNVFKDDEYFLICSDDEYSMFYSKKNNKIYFTTGNDYGSGSLYDLISQDFEYDKKDFIEPDKELGYYRLSKCPEQVKEKEFPI